jgi:hypothetical protein
MTEQKHTPDGWIQCLFCLRINPVHRTYCYFCQRGLYIHNHHRHRAHKGRGR